MIVAVVLTLLGLLLSVIAVETFDLRLSGVLVVPMIAVYTVYDAASVPVFGAGLAAAYVGLAIIKSRTFMFGRQLLLSAMVISVATTAAVHATLWLLKLPHLEFAGAAAVGSILPGVAAYNYHQFDDPKRRRDEFVGSLAAYAGLVVLGAAMVNGIVAPYLGRLTPPVVLVTEADVLNVRLGGGGYGSIGELATPTSVVFASVLVGMAVAEGVYNRWGVRLAGIISLPLLALFTLHSPVFPALYLFCAATVYAVIAAIHRLTLLYGRVLLALSIGAALLVLVPVAVTVELRPGLYAFFTAVLAGVGAYNLHRVPSPFRRSSIALSAGAYVSFLAGFGLLLGPWQDALRFDPVIIVVVGFGGSIAIASAVVAAIRLEGLRHSGAGEGTVLKSGAA